MIGQRHRAVGALEHLPALVAAHRRVVAPAVEQHNALLSGLQIVRQLGGQLLADVKAEALLHVHNLHLGQLAAQIPAGEGEKVNLPPLCLIKGLDRRGGRRHQQQRPMPPAAQPCDLPRVIARGLLGGVRALLLLVDDDQTDLFNRREHRRTGPHHHIRQTLLDALIFVGAFGHGQAAVQHRHMFAKPPAEQLDGLRGERNLRHQNDDAASLLPHPLGQFEIDLAFAAAGHPVQQRLLAPLALAAQLPQAVKRLLLGGRKLHVGRCALRRFLPPLGVGGAEDLPAVVGQQTLLLHLVQGLAGGAGVVAQLLERGAGGLA